ncbi:DUF362 domain-containing protein [Acidobacteriota bacterium]
MKRSKVFLIRSQKVISTQGDIDETKLRQMFQLGCRLIQESSGKRLFQTKETLGIKINTLGGKKISTPPSVSLSLAEELDKQFSPRSVIIWDRTNRELREAGYRLNYRTRGPLVMGTDTREIGYESELVAQGNIGSLFSKIQSNMLTSSISLAVLKDHGLAGVTAGMKNYFGAIHNPNKYHDNNCDPFIPELFDCTAISKKHRISIIDGLVVQYHRGPSFHAQWAHREGVLIFSLDPVAADYVGWDLIEKLRSRNGLPSLTEENREPRYLWTAEKMGLGTASPGGIDLKEEEL